MKTGAFLLASLGVLASGMPARAEDDSQQWLTVSARGEIAPKLSLQTETIARFSDDRGGLYQLQGIALLGYTVAEGITVWGGYVQSHEYADGGLAVERRAREQLTFDNFVKVGRASLSARFRLEQRWRDAVDGTAWRARPYLRASVPLGGKTSPNLLLSTEVFLNLNQVPFQTTGGLDRSRTAAALSFPLSDGVRFDAGYLNQHRFVRNGPDVDEHALTAALAFTF